MAIKAYCGVPGSGKSYEVVENVIMPAIKEGRRIFSNIAGVQCQAIRDYLVELGADEAKLGTIVGYAIEQGKTDNWVKLEGQGDARKLAANSPIQAGDLVIVDECWKWWAQGEQIHPDHREFWRMHRHCTHSVTGFACDLILVTQSFSDLNRTLQRICEERYVMTKLKAIGRPDRYRVDVFGPRERKPRVQYQKKYDKRIFALYTSYSMGKGRGVEKTVDDRGNIFKGSLFRVGLPLAALVGIGGMYGVWSFFKPKTVEMKSSPEAQALASAVDNSIRRAQPQFNVVGESARVPEPAVVGESEWRVYGHYTLGHRFVVVLQAPDGRLRYLENPADLKVARNEIVVTLEGRPVTYYSGVRVPASPAFVRPQSGPPH